MLTVYSPYYWDEYPDRPSVFLAGPTMRRESWDDLTPWRWDAMRALDGGLVAFVPEPPPKMAWDYGFETQVEWEEFHLKRADCIMFWVPRDMAVLPGLTTNIEWGRWCESGKVVLGAPPEAEHMAYMRYYAKKLGVPCADTMGGTARLASEMAIGRHR